MAAENKPPAQDPHVKTIKLTRFWLFGTFIIVFAAVTLYGGLFVGTAIFRELNYWLIIIITAVLCIGGVFGYEWWIKRQK